MNTKQTEIGEIPKDWEVVKLGEIAEIDSENLPSDTPPNYEFDYISLEMVDNGTLLGTQSICFRSAPSRARRVLRENDVLLSTVRPNLKSHYLVEHEANNLICSTGFSVIRARHGISNPGYLFQHLFSDILNNQIELLVSGSNYPAINSKDVKNLAIPLPPILEQTAIATILSDTDRLLAALRALIGKKHAVKTAAMQQLLSGSLRLPEFATNGSLKNSELGEIPEDWEVVKLGEVAHIKTGSKNNQDKADNGLYPFFVRSETVERINTFSYACEAILVPGEGGIGKIFHYINGKFDAHQRVYVIREFQNTVAKFVYFAMVHSFGVYAMENSVKATVDSLRLPTFKNFQFAAPKSKSEQTAIALTLSDMDSEIAALEARAAKLAQIKQGLMQNLLTGKIRVNAGAA